jgi:hypothetical protein
MASTTASWDRIVPRYRVTRDLKPAEKNRFRFEPPFAQQADGDIWQYGNRPLAAGEEIETKSWPHPTMHPLNESARRVLEFFKMRQRSRLPLSPWRDGRIVLDDGLTGSGPILPLTSGATA